VPLLVKARAGHHALKVSQLDFVAASACSLLQHQFHEFVRQVDPAVAQDLLHLLLGKGERLQLRQREIPPVALRVGIAQLDLVQLAEDCLCRAG
jgi:hypothetical protein